MEEAKTSCPYCSMPLEEWEPSPYAGFDSNLFYCNNDRCGYFIKGRKKICTEYDKNFAYRYCYNPKNRNEIPLIAWCPGDLSLKKGRCR